MIQKLRVIAPGTAVEVGDQIRAKVCEVNIEYGPRVTYRCQWFNNESQACEGQFEAFLVKPIAKSDNDKMGFRPKVKK